MEQNSSHIELVAEIERLKAELQDKEIALEEATDIIEAIRNGEVDALVMKSGDSHQLFTLKSADQTYRIFIEQMTEGAVTLNQNGFVVYANSQFASLLGQPLEKITGKAFLSFVFADDQDHFTRIFDVAWQKNIKAELRLSSDVESLVHVQLSLNILSLDEGLSMSIILTDLTEQKHNQMLLYQKNVELEAAQALTRRFNLHLEETVKQRTQELWDNQERLARILETMAEGVGIVDLQGNLTYMNPMAKKIFGLNDDQVLSSIYGNGYWTDVMIDGEPLAVREHPVTLALSGGKPVYDHEIGIQPVHGERFYVSFNAAPIRNEHEEIIAGVATFMDVTQRRKITQQKDEFISVASHELKTPITSLKASLQMLQRLKTDTDSDLFHKLMEQAGKSMNRVSVLIEDLLNASKFTGGQLHLKKQRINLYELVGGCCEDIRMEDRYKIRISGEKYLEVNADANKIDQVLINFINNAIKYAHNSLEILISIERLDGVARVSVSDKGPGIKAELISHLFDRYYRVDDTGRQYSGLGLGLYISSEIVKKHGGQIGVDSELGKGSTFWFTLPLSPTA